MHKTILKRQKMYRNFVTAFVIWMLFERDTLESSKHPRVLENFIETDRPIFWSIS